jgi:hypothetical protein
MKFFKNFKNYGIWALAILISLAIGFAYLGLGTLLLNIAFGAKITIWQFAAGNLLAILVRAVYSYTTKIKIE